MVKVKFFNLIRSKYRVEEEYVNPGSIHSIIEQILSKYPEMSHSDFKTCIVFYESKPIHYNRFDFVINEGEEIIITHFVGGG